MTGHLVCARGVSWSPRRVEYCLSEVQIVSKVFFPDLAQLGRALDRLRANLDVIIADTDPSITV